MMPNSDKEKWEEVQQGLSRVLELLARLHVDTSMDEYTPPELKALIAEYQSAWEAGDSKHIQNDGHDLIGILTQRLAHAESERDAALSALKPFAALWQVYQEENIEDWIDAPEWFVNQKYPRVKIDNDDFKVAFDIVNGGEQ